MKIATLGTLLVLSFISITFAMEYDMEKLMEIAKTEMMTELKEKTANGATSRRFSRRKFTEL